MTVDFLYQLVQFVCKKNQRDDIGSSRFNVAIQQGSVSFISYLIGEYTKYQPGRPVPPVALGHTKRVRQSLSVLIDPPFALTVNPVTGVAPYPTGYLYTDAMYTSAKKKIKYIEQNELASYLESVVDPIASNPVYLIQQNGFQFYPITTAAPLLSYIKNPPPINWAFSLTNGREVYDASNSTQPVWSDIDCLEVTVRALRMCGVHLQFNDVSQYANEIKASVGQ